MVYGRDASLVYIKMVDILVYDISYIDANNM